MTVSAAPGTLAVLLVLQLLLRLQIPLAGLLVVPPPFHVQVAILSNSQVVPHAFAARGNARARASRHELAQGEA